MVSRLASDAASFYDCFSLPLYSLSNHFMENLRLATWKVASLSLYEVWWMPPAELPRFCITASACSVLSLSRPVCAPMPCQGSFSFAEHRTLLGKQGSIEHPLSHTTAFHAPLKKKRECLPMQPCRSAPLVLLLFSILLGFTRVLQSTA